MQNVILMYWKAEIWDANYTRRGTVTGSTVKELRHNFVKWKRINGVPVNSRDYMLVNKVWVN